MKNTIENTCKPLFDKVKNLPIGDCTKVICALGTIRIFKMAIENGYILNLSYEKDKKVEFKLAPTNKSIS